MSKKRLDRLEKRLENLPDCYLGYEDGRKGGKIWPRYKIVSTQNLEGTVIKSNGMYDGAHWYFILLGDKGTYYTACEHNNFNTHSIDKKELLDGYVIVLPQEVVKDYQEFMEDLNCAWNRWEEKDLERFRDKTKEEDEH